MGKNGKLSMGNDVKVFKVPIQVYFIWHSEDNGIALPLTQRVFKDISRDISDPHERFIGIPLFSAVCENEQIKQIDIDRAYKTIIFPFLTSASLTKKCWEDHVTKTINDYKEKNNITIIPLTTSNCMNFFSRFGSINAIIIDPNIKKHILLVELYHGIISAIISDSKALKLFLSHTKKDELAEKLVDQLNSYICTHTTLKKFFDVNDIPKGERIGKKIDAFVGFDTTFLSICSESYESRYWCQHEVMMAKKNHSPIIVVNIENNIISRRFPFLSNVPSIRLNMFETKALDEESLTYILTIVLIENIKIRYLEKMYDVYEKLGWMPRSYRKLLRAPEPADICEILSSKFGVINDEKINIIYPEPLIYSEELSAYESPTVRVKSLLTHFGEFVKKPYNAGISISDPNPPKYLTNAGIFSEHVSALAQDIGRYCIAAGMDLIYGGDFRKGGITEFLTQEAFSWNDKNGINEKCIRLYNYTAWPIYNKNSKELSDFKADNINVLEVINCSKPKVKAALMFKDDEYIEANSKENNFVWCNSLSEMRKEIAYRSDIRICAGGKVTGYKGRMPGVVEEILLTLMAEKPLFLLGGFGGVVSLVCQQLLSNYNDGHIVDELTLEWQTSQNDLYAQTYKYAKSQGDDFSVDYVKLRKLLSFDNLKNGLTMDQNRRLFETQFLDEAMYLIFKGLKNLEEL